MDILSTILNFVAFLVVMVVALIALLIVLLIVISLLPRDNPLRQMMIALAKPVGVMVGVSVVGVPVEFTPGIDVIYDIAGLIFIVYSWIKFSGEARLIWPDIGQYFSARVTPSEASLTAQECFRRAQTAKGKRDWNGMLHWMRLAAQRGHDEARIFVEDVERRSANRQEEEARKEEQLPHQGRELMTRAEALEILDLTQGATREQIMIAYKRLMQNIHPDKGGSTFFAKQLNEAREVLLS